MPRRCKQDKQESRFRKNGRFPLPFITLPLLILKNVVYEACHSELINKVLVLYDLRKVTRSP